MRADLVRGVLAAVMMAFVIAGAPAQLAAEEVDTTAPPPTEERAPEEPVDTTPAEDAEPDPEPGDVPIGVWIALIVLLVFAVGYAVWQTTRSSS